MADEPIRCSCVICYVFNGDEEETQSPNTERTDFQASTGGGVD